MMRIHPHHDGPLRRERCSALRAATERWRRGMRADSGRVTAFVVVFAVAVIAMGGLVLDGGIALTGTIGAIDEAQEAARAGAQAIDLGRYRATGTLRLDPNRAAVLARAYLTQSGHHGSVAIDGNTVRVAVTTTHRSILLGVFGMPTIQSHGSGTARPEHGVDAPEP